MKKTLADWEASFKPFFDHIKLLGEIPITHIELDQISNLIRDQIKMRGPSRATRVIEDSCPRTFAVFLASIAAHNIERSYWDVVAEAVGCSKQTIYSQKWGELFLDILKDYSLPAFSEIQSYRFVAPIRMHGGIPAYSLTDFFNYILWPSVDRQRYQFLSTQEVISVLLKKSSIKFYVDSPVYNFLQNGGEYAVEFVDRCRKMARLYRQNKDVPDPGEFDVPPYVVRKFQQFVDEELVTDRGRRLRAPKLYLDPWGPDFYLYLPQQPIAGQLATRQYSWTVEMQGADKQTSEHQERVRVRRRGYDIETTEIELPLENPTQLITIQFNCLDTSADGDNGPQTHIVRRWRLNLLPAFDQPPLLAFNPNDGQLLRWNQTLPAKELWLLSPIDVDIQAEGEASVVENFPDFYGSWGQWTVQSWDLSRAHSLQLVKDSKNIKAPIPIMAAPVDPLLVGDNVLKENVDPDNVPLFIGAPPWIRIPIRPDRAVETELALWQLDIESRWAANPKFNHAVFPLPNLMEGHRLDEDAVELPMAAALGHTAWGTYQVNITGPYGIRTNFRFRVWPELSIRELKPYYFPSQAGAESVTFFIDLPRGCEVQPQAGTEGVLVTHLDESYRISVKPEVAVADLHLLAHQGVEEPIRLPLSIAVPRLRWSMLLGEDQSEIKWSTSPSKSTVGALLQADKGTLIFELPLVDELPLIFNVVLVNPEDEQVMQEHLKPKEVHYRQTRWRFMLGEFHDTMRHFDDQPVFEFQLHIQNTRTNLITRFPILQLSRTLDIKVVWIEHLNDGSYYLRWIESKPIRNRRVRIWSEWQPWLDPIELKIPDDARGELLVTDAPLSASQYRMHFFTAAPWDPENPPSEPSQDSIRVETTTPQDRLKTLSQKVVESACDDFYLHFEQACIFHTQSNMDFRDKEISWCYKNLADCSPGLLLAFYLWLSSRDPSTQKAVRLKMYLPKNLETLFSTYPQEHPDREAYLADFSITPMIQPKSAVLVLEHTTDPEKVMHGLMILVRRNSSQAMRFIFSSIEAGQLSDPDAGEMFNINPEFTLPALADQSETPLKLRMIRRMTKMIPTQDCFVLKGFWINTYAGWGRIEEIFGGNEENSLAYFNRKKDNPKLMIVLRPDHDPERVTFNLETRVITFLDVNRVYMCTKDNCYRFASKKMEYARNEHNRAAHSGLGPRFRPYPGSFDMARPEYYALDPPDNQFE